jgi:hypothetical protein
MPSVAVLGVEAIDVPLDLAQQLTDALRQRVSATPGVKPIAGKDLVEIKMVFGCDTEHPACLAQAGKSLGAEKLLYGTLKKASKTSQNLVVALKLLDVKSGQVEKFVNETVGKRELAAGQVNASAGRWFGALVEVAEAKPTLNVTSEPSNAAVAVDGQPAGRTPITLRDLSPGAHTIAVSMGGKKTVTRTVELRPGASHEVSVSLESEGAPLVAKVPEPKPEPVVKNRPELTQTTPPKSHPGRAAKIAALGMLVGGVVAGAVAIYTWRSYADLEGAAQRDLEPLAMARPPVTEAEKEFFRKPGCDVPAAYAGSAGEFVDHCKQGETFAATTTALWVVAGALAGTSVILYVVGDRQAAKAAQEQPKSTARTIQKSLKLAPVFSTQSGGLSASFEF